MNEIKNILVTGGAGLIGTILIDHLNDQYNFSSIDINETMYKAYRLMSDKQINCILVTKNKKIISYLTLHEINESLSKESILEKVRNSEKVKRNLSGKNFLWVGSKAESCDVSNILYFLFSV